MKEHPILFNCDMVRAILRGQKTQTRRPIMPQPVIHPDAPKPFGEWTHKGQKIQWGPGAFPTLHFARHCPFGQPGDLLWVRETFARHPQDADSIFYRADDSWYRTSDAVWANLDGPDIPVKWTPSIHMPRALSRITLEITDINVDRVQDIAEKDAWAEGMEALDGSFNEATLCATAKRYHLCVEDSRCIYAHLWDSLYAKRGLGWNANPWVWVVEFECVEVRCKK